MEKVPLLLKRTRDGERPAFAGRSHFQRTISHSCVNEKAASMTIEDGGLPRALIFRQIEVSFAIRILPPFLFISIP